MEIELNQYEGLVKASWAIWEPKIEQPKLEGKFTIDAAYPSPLTIHTKQWVSLPALEPGYYLEIWFTTEHKYVPKDFLDLPVVVIKDGVLAYVKVRKE